MLIKVKFFFFFHFFLPQAGFGPDKPEVRLSEVRISEILLYSDHSLLRVLPCPSGCLSALRDCFSSCLLGCSLLRLWFFLHRVCLALLLWLQVVAFMTRSNLRFPSRRGLPLGRVRIALASVFSVRVACLCCFPFCLSTLRLPCSQLAVSACRVHQMGSVGFFSWCSVSFGVGSFLGRF